ncbi:MAG: hypothetical protein LBU76_06845 [Azoarcus sp.]|jgi:hypothetical protein|nr:hypothetical protein [Azoarcus sp.]
MYRGGDSVFRLSLIGIAFILIFFLLTMFSRMYASADIARTEAVARLGQQQETALLQASQQAFESARKELQPLLQEGGMEADKVIQSLLDKAKVEAELATEKKRTQELSAQVMGLSEAKKILTQASSTPVLNSANAEALVSALELRARMEQELLATPGQSASKLTDNEIVSRALAAIRFKRNIETLVESELGLPLMPGQEAAWEQWLIADSQLFRSALDGLGTKTAAGGATDSALRGQLAFLRTRLASHNDKTLPPCWFDDASRVQYLLEIELRPGNVIVKSAWPPEREDAAQSIPGITQVLNRGPQPYPAFMEKARAIARHGGHGGQQCRYSAQVKDSVRSGMRSEKIHQELEQFLHLTDLPR